MEPKRNCFSFMIREKFNYILKLLCLSVLLFSCQKKEKTYFETIASNDVKLSSPKPGEWRYKRDEKYQTFEDFEKSKKIIPIKDRNIIYLQPIGEFNDLQKKQIKLTKEYLTSFFQLETRVLTPLSNKIFPKSSKRIKDEHEQVLAGYVLNDVLMDRKPKDAVVLMGITEKDLFPKPEWNYVFGMASYGNGVGVTSMYRFANGELTESNFSKSLERLLKTSSHEIGHMFGISHCLNANCVMNGTNHLPETDTHFARACSLCQQKLYSSIKYDNTKRLIALKNFFEKQHLNSEIARAEEDLKLLK